MRKPFRRGRNGCPGMFIPYPPVYLPTLMTPRVSAGKEKKEEVFNERARGQRTIDTRS